VADRLGYKATAAGSQAYRHSTGSATEPLPRVYRLAGTQPARLQSHCRGLTGLQALNRPGYRATAAGLQAYRHSTGSATEPLPRVYRLTGTQPARLESHFEGFARLQTANRLRYRATSKDLHACRQRTGSATEPPRRIRRRSQLLPPSPCDA